MTAVDICAMVARGESPERLDGPGQLLWYRVRDIKRDYSRRTITEAEARERKKRAILDYNRDSVALKDAHAAYKRTADLFARVELACAAYRKNKTLEAADAIITAIHGI